MINAVDFDGHQFMFRKDVLYTVAEVVQRGMLQLFEGAHDISCTIADCTGTYPILTSDCLRHTKTCLIRNQDIFDSDIVDGLIEHDRMPDERYRDSILLLLSRRAAIARMTNEAMELAWTALVNTIAFLIRPAGTELVSGNECGTGKRVLAPGQSIFTVPPLSLSIVCPYCLSRGSRMCAYSCSAAD
jgi:hypothetical protein